MHIQRKDKAFIFCVDQSYAPHAGTCIFSILLSTIERDFDVIVIDNGLDHKDYLHFTSLEKVFGVTVKLYDGTGLAGNLRSIADASRDCRLAHVSDTTLLRLFYDEIIERTYGRVAYLDSDMVCIGSAGDIFSVELNGDVLGAAPDLITNKDYMPASSEAELRRHETYFNAGVLVIDDDLWRTRKVSDSMKKILVASRPEELTYADQDVLNMHFGKSGYTQIGREFNYQYMATLGSLLRPQGLSIEDAKIIHFAGEIKPWHSWSPIECRNLYERYRILSPWGKGYSPREPGNLRQLSLACKCFANQGRDREAYLASQALISHLRKARPRQFESE
jgi:UDP-glucose:(glucosyl)LPS alpha-1,3-glucosyltransferase